VVRWQYGVVPDAVPRVLLDASAIVGAGFGQSGPFRHLLRDAADKRVEVLVPEVAIVEAVFVFRRDLAAVRDALEALPKLMRAAGYEWDLLQRPTLARRMEERLRRQLADANVEPLAAPAVDGDVLVQRILRRRKPTKPLVNGPDGRELRDQPEGFRDQLVWEHVRAAAEAGPLVFLCDNTRDFAARRSRRDGRARLHFDLLEDLEADRSAGRSTGEVELLLDVETFVREYLHDENVVDDVRRLLDGDAGDEVVEQARELVARDGLTVDGFVPPVALHADVEEATLTLLAPRLQLELVDAYLESSEDEPREYGVTLTLTGDGTIDWVVSAPASWDLEAFADLVDGDTAGGGFIHDVDTSPVTLTAYGRYRPSTEEWTALEFELAEQASDEYERRTLEHQQRWIAFEQEVGLLPTGEELEVDDKAPPRPVSADAFRLRRRR
jgi:predicted nucleic acid-binding protein